MKRIYTLIITLFLLAFYSDLSAQNKYEYGQVVYLEKGRGYAVITSISDEFKIVDEGKIADGDLTTNFVAVNKVLNDLSDKGWEVYNTTMGSFNATRSYYYIRKKKS